MSYSNMGSHIYGALSGHQLHSDFQAPPEILLFQLRYNIIFIRILHCQ